MRKIWVGIGLLVWVTGLLGAVPAAPVVQQSPRNLIWVIGDGMGPELMGFWMQGVRQGAISGYPQRTSALEQLLVSGSQGIFFTDTASTVVTDSAAAATQMASGERSVPGYIGLDAQGHSVPTLLEIAKQHGKAVGIISDTYVTDATPAGFTAHTASRRHKMEIARQQLALEPEVILGGGLKYFSTGENKDLLKQARQQGYQTVFDKKALQKVRGGKVLGLFDKKAMPMSVEMPLHPNLPSLALQTQKALEILEDSAHGFVLLVEAGKIDWAAHENDAGATLAEMRVLDQVLDVVRTYADTHPDTLLYLNADHDTGLGSFTYRVFSREEALHRSEQGEVLYDGDTSYASFDTYALLEKQRSSLYSLRKEITQWPAEKRTRQRLEKAFSRVLGYPLDMSSFQNLQDVSGLFVQLNQKYGIVWATQTHSSSLLLGVAYGPQQQLFGGVYHNTDILPKIKRAFGWGEN